MSERRYLRVLVRYPCELKEVAQLWQELFDFGGFSGGRRVARHGDGVLVAFAQDVELALRHAVLVVDY